MKMRLPGGAHIQLNLAGQRCCISRRAMIPATVMDLIHGVVATRDRSMPARFKARAVRSRAEPLAPPSAAVFAMIRDRSCLTQKDRTSGTLFLAALVLMAIPSGCATTGGQWNDADTAAFIGGFTGYPVYSAPVYRTPPQRRYIPPARQATPVYNPPPQQTYPSGGSSDDCDWSSGACSAQ